MPSAPPTSTRPSRASARAEPAAVALALLLATLGAGRATADEGRGHRVSRSTRYDDDAWARGDAAPEPPRPAPGPEPEPPPPTAGPTLAATQAEAMGFGLEVATDPTDPYAGRAELFYRLWLVPGHAANPGRALHLGFGFFLHTGGSWSELTDSASGRTRWVSAWLLGGEPSVFVMCRRGLYLRAGVNLELQVRRAPIRLEFAPRFAAGFMGKRQAFEVGVGWEPYLSARLHDAGEAWDDTSRAWLLFFRIDFHHMEL